ncbi:tannase and feruloyl esterase-domain-containing protein [Mycena vulgaris]|nr:tannase and feruloyl esterase-domain-containing protein [Mycena vulgaris]
MTEPDDCHFHPEAIACTANQTTNCLTPPQVQALKNIYSPLLGSHGELIYPRYSPGAEADPTSRAIFGGAMIAFPVDWERYTILNTALFDKINPGGIATYDGDMSAFRNRGGKFLTYHGQRDPLISSTNSKRVYDLISHTLALPSLDDFYRLFLIPGMGHCSGALVAPSFGQGTFRDSHVVNASSHNILLALEDWVEGGVAPDTIIGSGANGTVRTHCRYPMRSVFDGKTFVCV